MPKSILALLVVCILLFALSGGGCQRALNPPVANVDRPLRSEREFKDKLAELRMQRDKSSRAIARLEQEKAAAVTLLKNKGVTSPADLEKDTALKYAANQLKSCKADLERLQKERGFYDEAIAAIEASLSDIARKNISEAAALSEEEYSSLRKIVLDLNDRLKVDEHDPIADAEMEELLKDELGDQ